MNYTGRCNEKMTTYAEFDCSNKAVFAVVYTTPDDQTEIRYCCTAHAGKALKYVTKHKHPVHRQVTVLHLEKDIA